MPVAVSFPGVYVEEIPSGLHTIAGVATSICAFVGVALRGPVDTPTEIFSFADYENYFGGLTLAPDGTPNALGFAVRDFFINGGGDAIVVRVGASKNGDSATASATIGGILTLSARSGGVWGNGVAALVDFVTNPTSTNKSLFNLTVRQLGPDGKTVVASERFQNVSTNVVDPTYVVGVLAAGSALVVASPIPAGKNFTPPAPAAATATATASAPGAPATAPAAGAATATKASDGLADFIPLTGGKDGTIDASDILGDPAKKSGLYALDKADIFNILIIPSFAHKTALDIQPVVSAAVAYCASRRAMLLIDPPDSWNAWDSDPSGTLTTILADVGTLHDANASYAAAFFPNIVKANPLRNNQLESFAPSGSVAGVFARTDAQRGVWKAPAGLEALLTDAPALAASVTNMEDGKLNAAGVNCLRAFPIVGRVVWGSRTLDGADILESDYKYIPVRRFTLFLEESLYRGTQWVVFEPNDEPLWSQVRLNVGSFMHDLFRQGAFQGSTPKDAYFVQCDASTTTQSDIDRGIVNIVVGFAPLKPAEFVILQIQQMTGQLAT